MLYSNGDMYFGLFANSRKHDDAVKLYGSS